MTTLENRLHTALLVVDMQNGVLAEAHDRELVAADVDSLVLYDASMKHHREKAEARSNR